MYRWLGITIAISTLTGCISVTTPPTDTSENNRSPESAREIAELRDEIRSLKDSLKQNKQPIRQPSDNTDGDIDYAYIEEVIRETSTVGAMSGVAFTVSKDPNDFGIMMYEVSDGEYSGANGTVFIEQNFGSVFTEFRDYYGVACRDNGDEFFEISQSADSDVNLGMGTMSYVYACLSRSEGVQIIGRSESLFTLDRGVGFGYTEVIPYSPLSYKEALRIVRDKQGSF